MTPFFDENASREQLTLFIDRVRTHLHAKVLAAVEADITAAIEYAMADLRVSIKSSFEHHRLQNVTEIILTDMRAK